MLHIREKICFLLFLATIEVSHERLLCRMLLHIIYVRSFYDAEEGHFRRKFLTPRQSQFDIIYYFDADIAASAATGWPVVG